MLFTVLKMKIIYERKKKQKRHKPKAIDRQLAADWIGLLAKHGAPLEKGAKSCGSLPGIGTLSPDGRPLNLTCIAPYKRFNKEIPSLPMQGVATKPSVDILRDAKRQLAPRTGLGYNKGGLQYLTDDELAEQRTGVHKRR
jgi:hypothetical protein